MTVEIVHSSTDTNGPSLTRATLWAQSHKQILYLYTQTLHTLVTKTCGYLHQAGVLCLEGTLVPAQSGARDVI